MPVYEFYCADCHTVFNFLSRRVDTDKRPACPRCRRPDLERQVSRFAYSKGRSEESADGFPEVDDERLEKAMMGLAAEMEGLDENDPRALAAVMRKLSEAAGADFGSGFDEALRRLESGDDPEKIEEEMGKLLDGDVPFSRERIRGIRRTYTPPAHDETLYLL